jgi:hypothetical protein
VTTDQETIECFWISRDGQWLLFDSDRSGTQQIFRRRLSGGEVQQVTHGTSPAFYPALSPDGREVAYHSIVNGFRRVFVASSDGGDRPVQVSAGTSPDELQPDWSPDGKRLAWIAVARRQVRAAIATRSAQGWGAPREVTHPGVLITGIWADSVELVAADTALHRLVLVNADDPAVPPRFLVELSDAFQAPPVVSADYRTLLYHTGRALWVLSSRGGGNDRTLREAVRFDDPLHPHTLFRSVAAQGGFLYFTLQHPQSNIWVARVTGLKR